MRRRWKYLKGGERFGLFVGTMEEEEMGRRSFGMDLRHRIWVWERWTGSSG